MKELDIVKAIVRYRSSTAQNTRFIHGDGNVEKSARFLLIQKAEDQNPENFGKWECPGGRMKSKETPLETITREMKEELPGLDFRVVKQLPTIRNCYVYLVDAASMAVSLSAEHSDYRWMKAEQVKTYDLVKYADLLLEFFNNPEKYFN